MYERRRNLVARPDGRLVNVARFRGQLFVCATGCCCGRTDDGFAPVPTELYHGEWERRRLRNVVHLTIGGCLGPCALANVVLLLFDGQALWFHSIDSEALVRALYDHIDAMLAAERAAAAPPALARLPVHGVDLAAAPGRPAGGRPPPAPPQRRRGGPVARRRVPTATASTEPRRDARAAPPARRPGGRDRRCRAATASWSSTRPWQGRVFGMAVALSEQGLFPWEEFRQALIGEIAAAEARGGEFRYYDAWLAAFERVLAARGVVAPEELEETTFQFEFGERDEV